MLNRRTLPFLTDPQTRLGVLSDREVLLVEVREGKRMLRSILLAGDVRDSRQLCAALWEMGLNWVWVMPTSTWSARATCTWLQEAHSHWIVLVHTAAGEASRPSGAVLWPKNTDRSAGRQLTLAFPEYADWGWVLPDARSLLATVTYLEQVLARPVLDSPTVLAQHLLTEHTREQPLTLFSASPVDLSRLSSENGTLLPLGKGEPELTWMRPLTLVEQRQKYLHSYRHLSLMLEACLEVPLGAGMPQSSSHGRAYDGKRPGFWRVSTEPAGSVFDGKRLPSAAEGTWMSTPQVACCRDIGYQLHIHEGVFWPEVHSLLAPWAKALWQAGERLSTHPQQYRHVQGQANALNTLRMLTQHGVASLAVDQTSGNRWRPDWYAQIVGGSRARLFAHLVRLVGHGTMPIVVAGDALWVVSDNPNPLTAVPELFSTRRWHGYTVRYTVPLPLSREVKAAFRTATDAHLLVVTLDALALSDFP